MEILEYVHVTDLMSLTLTCKNFYSTVVDTKLMDKLVLKLTNERNGEEWKEVRRNYSQISITDCGDLENFSEIFEDIGGNLRNLAISKTHLKMSVLSNLLNSCPNLKFLTISELTIDSKIDDWIPRLPSYTNLSIFFQNTSPTFFQLLFNSQAKELIIDNRCSAQHINFDALKAFLRSQDHLQSLSLLYFSINTNLFADNLLDFVQFRLRRFSMNNVYLGIENVARFKTFMMNHVDSLTCLNVQSPFIDISFFHQFYSLNELHICHTNAFFEQFENVKVLTAENISGDWMMKFPNVKELTMIFKYGVFLGMYADLVKLVHLETLSIIDSKMPELNIPFVRKLCLKNATFCANRPFRYEDNQIRELRVEACSSIDWLADFLAQDSTRLKLLVLKNMEMIDLIKSIVHSNGRKKVEKLIFINS